MKIVRNQIGCFTSSGLISAVVTLLLVGGITFAKGNQIFSPGSLSTQAGKSLGGIESHSDLGGECSKCHTSPWNKISMDELCLDCHVEITGQLSDLNSMHAIIINNNPGSNCRTCHPEHKGSTAPLTVFWRFNFPHDNLGFSLNSHILLWDGRGFQCQDCHLLDYKNYDMDSCKTCHENKDGPSMNKHFMDFGSDCLACHDGLETYGKSFNHNDYSFKLTGKHSKLNCNECHIESRTKLELQATRQDCNACHQIDDPHTGRFGIACDDCHTPEGWKPAKFDHNLARFKLEGKHINVDCGECHLSSAYQGTPQDCVSCHSKDDDHQGVLGNDCGMCHSANGWKPSTFDHAQSAYPLTGSHIPVACEKCHLDKIFKGTPTECFACHLLNDKHNGLYGRECSVCHTTGGWLPSTFNHALNRFPLTGAHLGLACSRCHSNFNFRTASTLCVSCHGEPSFHAGSFGTNCADCHSTINWSASYTGPHPSFDEHGGIDHEGATCRDCHTINLITATCTNCHSSNNPRD